MQDKLRAAFLAKGLAPPDMITDFEFSRETIVENGIEVGHWWAPHVHGDIDISQGRERLQAALNSKFWVDRSTPQPALIETITDHAGWISYFLKDPRDLYRRVHFRWTGKPVRRRDGIPPVPPRSRAPSKRRNPVPKKQPMTEKQALPLMRLLARIPVQKTLLLLGFQFQGDFMTGRLLKWPPNRPHQGRTPTPHGDVNNSSEQGPTDQMDEVETHTHTSVPDPDFRLRLIESRARIERLRARRGYTPRPRK